MRVELLYVDGDPAAMTARQRLVEVLSEDAFETPIQMIAVASAADADLLGMRGSAGPAGIAPRDYGEGPVRSKPLIRAAVERARGWGHGRPR